MKSKAAVLGHPAHSMLVPFPLAFLIGSFAFDAAGRLAGNASLWTTGAYLSLAGIATALIAAIPGLIDYLYTVPPRSSGKNRATKHLMVNLTGVALFALGWWIRSSAAAEPAATVLALEGVAVGLLAAGGYMGGTLVTRNLIGVDHRYANAGRWRDTTIPAGARQPVTVAKRDELKVNQMKLVRLGDRRIALARTEQGYVAFDDRCTHKGGSLAGGVMMCGTVQCLWHGSQFEAATGKVKSGPARENIRVYQVSEDGDDVKLTV